jgi:hypothetical protein
MYPFGLFKSRDPSIELVEKIQSLTSSIGTVNKTHEKRLQKKIQDALEEFLTFSRQFESSIEGLPAKKKEQINHFMTSLKDLSQQPWVSESLKIQISKIAQLKGIHPKGFDSNPLVPMETVPKDMMQDLSTVHELIRWAEKDAKNQFLLTSANVWQNSKFFSWFLTKPQKTWITPTSFMNFFEKMNERERGKLAISVFNQANDKALNWYLTNLKPPERKLFFESIDWKQITRKTLDLSSANWLHNTQFGLQHLLMRMPQLTHLNLAGDEDLTDSHLAEMAKLLPKLESLAVPFCNSLKGSCLQAKKFPSLQKLDLSHCPSLNPTHLRLLEKFTTLRMVDLSNLPMLEDKHLTFLKSLKNLEDLNVSFCQNLSDNIFSDIASCSGTLQALHLSGCPKLTGAKMECLTSFDKLKILDLCACQGLQTTRLSFLKTLPSLEFLDISNSGVSGQIIENLPVSLRDLFCENIKNLTDDHIESMQKLVALQKVHMGRNAAFTHKNLPKLAGLTQLYEVKLNGCSQLTDEIVEALLPLAQQLTVLDLSYLENLTEDIFPMLANFKNLLTLNLSGAKFLTDDDLFDENKNLIPDNDVIKLFNSIQARGGHIILQDCENARELRQKMNARKISEDYPNR